MSSKLKVKLNTGEVRKLLKSAETRSLCIDYANCIQASAGSGFEVEESRGRNRNGAVVVTRTEDAYFHNLKHNTLIKAVNSVKGK